MRSLKKGDSIKMVDGSEVIVINSEPLGFGGQGEVYLVSWNGSNYAFKWYTNKECFVDTNPAFKNNLELLIEETSAKPNFYNSYVMPLQLSEEYENGQFGYVMKKIENMSRMDRILGGKCNFKDSKVQYKACEELVAAFDMIHEYNHGFMDINDGSIFFDLNTGGVKLCDCDNIAMDDKISVRIGKVGYMAPEIYLGNAKCSELTDRHSLAVILYQILIRGRPFEGKKIEGPLDEAMEHEIYGNPVFVFDPNNKTNQCVSEDEIQSWNDLPDKLKELFIETFTKGLVNPEERVTSDRWMGALVSIMHRMSGDPFLNKLKLKPIPKRPQLILFVIDSSYSMRGTRIAEVNKAIKSSIETLKELDSDNSEVTFEIAILQFSIDCQWYSDKQIHISNFDFKELETTGCATRFDRACMEIDSRLIKDDLLSYHGAYRRPLIILLSDGESSDYVEKLDELWNNKNFVKSIKIAIGVGSEGESELFHMLNKFTKNEKMVIKTDEIEGKLGSLIHNLTVRVSSTDTTLSGDKKIEKIIEQLVM